MGKPYHHMHYTDKRGEPIGYYDKLRHDDGRVLEPFGTALNASPMLDRIHCWDSNNKLVWVDPARTVIIGDETGMAFLVFASIMAFAGLVIGFVSWTR